MYMYENVCIYLYMYVIVDVYEVGILTTIWRNGTVP
jgi:hypothetical protein